MSEVLKKLRESIPPELLKTQLSPSVPLDSGISSLNQWLGGGLSWGRISEWGMPLGNNSRKLILSFLKKQNKNFLWIYSNKLEEIYPPAWASMVDLEKAYFIQNDKPIKELKACFLDNYFPMIIIDSALKLNVGDMAFLSSQTRAFDQHVFLIRPYFLSNKKGNPYARHRINTFKRSHKKLELKKLRGPGLNTDLQLNLSEVSSYECSSSFF